MEERNENNKNAPNIMIQEENSGNEIKAPKSPEISEFTSETCSKSSTNYITESFTESEVSKSKSTDLNNIESVTTEVTTSNDISKEHNSLITTKQSLPSVISDSQQTSDIDIMQISCSDNIDQVATSNNIFEETNKNMSKNATIPSVISDSQQSIEVLDKPNHKLVLDDSDSEDEVNTNKIKGVTKHRSALILTDSDSDSENKISTNQSQSEDEETSNNKNSSSKKLKRVTMFDSDSDSDHTETITSNKSYSDNVESYTTNSELISETDVTETITPHKSLSNNAEGYTTNSELGPETDVNVQKSKLAMLCDPESDVEPDKNDSDDEIVEQTQPQSNKINKTWKKKAKKLKPTNEVTKPLNSKEAAKQREEIQSESQRMLREKNTSLPYHKPKTHSLKDFLARRPKLPETIPLKDKTHPSVAIKMSTEQLKIISKRLQEREKELKQFYKSESESEENENDSEYIPPTKEDNNQLKVIELAQDEVQTDLNKEIIESDKVSSISSNLVLINGLQDSFEQNERSTETETIFAKETQPIELETQNSMEFDKIPQITNSEESEKAEAEHQPAISDIGSVEIKKTQQVINLMKDTESESFNFHLEDEFTEKTELPKDSSKFVYTDLDKEIENSGINNSQDGAIIKSNETFKSKLQLIKEKLANNKPQLSGGPDQIIDLNSDIAKPQEVVQLMQRFAKHTSATKHHHHPKHKVKLNIIRVETGGDIQTEEVAMNIDSEEESAIVEEKPGAKYKKLKEELQKQMDQKKSEIWQQKASKGIKGSLETAEDDEETEKDILDFDEEEEAIMTDEEEEIDEELIEDDMDMSEKTTKKSIFLDQEAAVSETEEDSASVKEGYETNITENEEDEKADENLENEDSNLSTPSETESLEESSGIKKPLKRIIKPADDSDDEDLFNESMQKSITQLDSTITADEDEIPPHQPPREQFQTPIKPVPSQTKSIADFLTPISFITSIQNLNSAKSNVSPFRLPHTLQTPDKEAKIRQKKLFADTENFESQSFITVSQSQESLSNLMQLQEDNTVSVKDTPDTPSTQDLLGICSGKFTGETQLEPQTEEFSELKSASEEDMIISQLIDEEELETFKKKFEIESPKIISQKAEPQEIIGGGIIDSDEEGEETQQKRKNKKRLQFSDEESSDEELDNEVIDLQDNEGLDEEDIDNIAYDSEENEIELNNEEKAPERIKLSDFVEAEAELSESEWDSEDEDEKGLDDLEFELGDTEKFDDEKMKSDLEKIHMRRMLDEDNREVKLLQELLLEDGEMHGTGRQRQFKWKNIDSIDNEEEKKQDNDEVYLDEEESEEQWRKRRHEREMLLKKLQGNNMEEELGNNSQLFKLGRKFLKKSQSNSQNSTPSEKAPAEPASPFKLTPFPLQNKRGSFLNRSDQVLQRVAEFTKVTVSSVSDSKKTTKHFLFQSSSTLESSAALEKSKKRKASEGTPNILKKLRLTTNLSPAIKKKFDKSERSKKLFNF